MHRYLPTPSPPRTRRDGTWDIGLHQRRGIGYVYSSRHTNDTRAEEVLRGYIGKASDGLNPRQLKLNVGYREQHWVKNCVAVGLSGGFLEPLESSRHRPD